MKRLSGVLLFVFGLTGSQPGIATRYDVLAGSDYFVTQPGTIFAGVPFAGVPIGPGGSDTIVERLQDVSLGTGAPASGTTPLLMTDLELESTVPADFGLGTGFYFITLQSARGGPATTGDMTINLNANDDHTPSAPEGTFSSFFDVFFDVRFGAANGPIAMSSDLVLTNSGAAWDANPTASDFLVPGLKGDVTANFHTNKIQNIDINDMDFFPIGAFQESEPGGAVHVVANATPEPGTIGLLCLGLAGLGLLRWQRKQ
jgi:hypothetical protein